MSPVQVTILMPAYNAEKYIADAIHSVLEQSFTGFELLIVNDGSTDHTTGQVKLFNDSRVKLINIAHGGVALALNKGLSLAQGKYIARFDADDICLPGRLQQQYDFLEKKPDYVIVGSDAEYMMEDGEHLFDFSCIGHTDEELRNKLFFYCPFIHSAVMYRKEAVVQAGGYCLHAHNFEDYFLWVQLAKSGKLHNLPQRLIRIRFNPSSVTIDEKWRGSRFRALKRNAITKGTITEKEGAELWKILQQQDVEHFKLGAYYALCAKKMLTGNYQPARSRGYVVKAIRVSPLRWDNYAILLAGILPKYLIQWLHQKSPNRL